MDYGLTRPCTLLLALALSVAAHADESVINDWAAELARAHQNREAIPVLSYHYTRVDNFVAYKIQAAYVQLRINTGRYERVSGYKAAATSKVAQKAIAARAPMGGVMFESGAARIRRRNVERCATPYRSVSTPYRLSSQPRE